MTGDDVVAALSPAALGPNVLTYFSSPQVGARITLLEHWSVEEALKLIEKEKVTIPCLVPTQLAQLAAHPALEKYDLSSIRVFFVTGSALPYHMAVDIEERLRVPIVQAYGSVDFGGVAISSKDEPRDVRLLTVGKAYLGNEIKLIDKSGKEVTGGQVGAILVKGAVSSSGYYLDSAKTSQTWDKNGWYRTNDLGKFDEQGNLIVSGRENDMIIRGGQNIYPVEVENLLLTHPKIADVAIIGIPDPIMGERACAIVVVKSDMTFLFDEMISFLKTKGIASYKLPESIVLVDSLPYVGGMKLDRKELKGRALKWLTARENTQ
jgi:fatty-acyl-CoA synthase